VDAIVVGGIGAGAINKFNITGITVFKLFPDNMIIFILGWSAVVLSTILFLSA
jgi:hypothetical protein